LKNQLGLSYKLTVNRNNVNCSSETINKFLSEKLGSEHLRCISNDSGKVAYQVAQLSLEILGNLLKDLDEAKEEIGFDSYKLTILDSEDALTQANYQELFDNTKVNYEDQNYKSVKHEKVSGEGDTSDSCDSVK